MGLAFPTTLLPSTFYAWLKCQIEEVQASYGGVDVLPYLVVCHVLKWAKGNFAKSESESERRETVFVVSFMFHVSFLKFKIKN